jgi:alpha-1,6-mannosyltransferase
VTVDPRRATLLTIALGVIVAAAALVARFGDLSEVGWTLLAAYAGTGVGLALVLVVALLGDVRLGRLWMPAVLVTAFVLRAILIPTPFVSEDAARYHWDGKLLAHGVNPYLTVPNSPELAEFATDDIDDRISERSERTLTVYPPLAQILFAAAYLTSPGSLVGFQILWLLAEAAAWLFLVRELRRRNRPRAPLLLLAWSPLVLYWGYLPGHLDTLYLPFVTLFLVAVDREQPARAGLWMALACLIKPFPAILLPAAFIAFGPRRFLRTAMAGLAVTIVFYLPFLDAGWNLFSSMWLMARAWSFNGSTALLFEGLLPMTAAHLVSGVFLVGMIAASLRLGRDFHSRCLMAAAAFVIASPTVFPWYLMWIFPLLVLRPDPALVALIALIPLSDLVMIEWVQTGKWQQPIWTMVVEYGAFYGLLFTGWRRGWGMFRGAGPREASP